MNNSKTLHIEFQNGKSRDYMLSDFEFFSTTKELEHHTDNIIISLEDIKHSFVYELDDNNEIFYKEQIKVTFVD